MSGIYTDYRCIKCLLNKYADVEKISLNDKSKTMYLKELLNIICKYSKSMTAPELTEKITFLQKKYKIDAFDYSKLKAKYNSIMLSYENEILTKIKESDDRLYTAMCYAFTGNYIDFGAMSDITEEKLSLLIENTKNIVIDKNEYENLKKELKSCKSLVYLTDNCGEIVFDKLFISEIKNQFPDVKITIITRGKNVLNDATLEDAVYVGLDKVASITDNGTGIAGTSIKKINSKSKKLIKEADIVISKGMGNFETLKGVGLNIYYMFMCKCIKFCEMFDAEHLSYMLANEKRLQ